MGGVVVRTPVVGVGVGVVVASPVAGEVESVAVSFI